MKNYYLYVLIDPDVKIPKYIGISNNPERRFKEHLEDISNTPKVKWISRLKEGGKLPILKVVKNTTNVHQVCDWERQAIAKYQDTWGLVNATRGGEYYAIGTPIDVYDLEGNYLDSYDSMVEYCELNGLSKNYSAISQVCLKKRNYAYGRIFRYSGDLVTNEELEKLKSSFHNRDPKHFIIVTPKGEILGEFDSLQEAERQGFGSQGIISEVLREVPGYNSVNGNLVCYSMEDFDNKLKKYLKGKSKNTLEDCISKYDLDGNILGTYYSLSDACFSIDPNFKGNTSLIKGCCEGKYQQAFGFQWKYGNDKVISKFKGKIKRKANQPVEQYSKTGELIKVWSCAREAADTLNISREAINRAANGASKSSGGYIWKYV